MQDEDIRPRRGQVDRRDDPRALALPDWDTLCALANAVVNRSHGEFPGWDDVVKYAARIGEVSGVRKENIDRDTWMWTVRRQTTPGPGGLIDKGTKGKRPVTFLIVPSRGLLGRSVRYDLLPLSFA